jgi:chromate transporter
MITPALLIVPLVHFAGRHMQHPRLRSMFEAVVIASAGLLLAVSVPLAHAALSGKLTLGVAALSLVLLFATRLDTVWVILGASLLTLGAAALA